MRSSVLGGQVVAELSGSGAFTRGYVYLGGQLLAVQQNSAVSWVHQDPVTKSRRVTNPTGSIVSTIELDPWGGNTNRSSNDAFQPRKFTTYERDANASDEAMHRRYNRWWSRFDQPDPYDGSYNAADPQSFNRYAYVQNDPVNFVDPTGLLPGAGCSAESSFADCYGTGGGGGFWGGGWNFNDRGRPGQDVIGAREGERDIAIQVTRQFRYIPANARYLGGLTWGWTDYSQETAPSYSYSFRLARLNTLTMSNGRLGWDGGTLFRGVDGYPYEKGGLDMHPTLDPVWIAAGLAAGAFTSSVRNSAVRQITIKSEHFFAQHFASTGITQGQLNAALRQTVQGATRGASSTGSFWGRFTLNGVPIEYHAHTFAGRIYIGTAWPWPK